MSKYAPDNWTIIGDGENFKVFGSWAGGYLGSDNWRLSSGIVKIEEDPENEHILLIHNHSGSIYKCGKHHEGVIAAYNRGVLNNMLKKNPDIKTYTLDEYKEAVKES